MSRRQYKMKNLLSVLPESHTTGSTNCKTALLYCPNLTLRAVQIAKRSLCTAQIAHPEQCHRRKRSNTLPFHSRPPILRQCQNQNPPHALPNLPNTSTQRQCQSAIINSPLPTYTLRSHHQHNPTPSRKSTHQTILPPPSCAPNSPSPLHHTSKKDPSPGNPRDWAKYSIYANRLNKASNYLLAIAACAA